MKHRRQVRRFIQTMLFKSQPHDAGATAPDKGLYDRNVLEATVRRRILARRDARLSWPSCSRKAVSLNR